MNNLKKYLILLELMSFKRIDLDIIKKKYRELAMRFHPDITGRDTNKEMAEINNAYEYLIRNISAANEELKNIWREKEAEFARIYRDAIIKDLSSATISQLRRSINLFNTISGYKDVEDLINKYTTQLNKLLKEEARKERIYKQAILDIRNATMKELEEAISLLKTIPNYKDSNNLILIYSNRIEKIKEEIKKNESYYKQIQKIKNDSITDSELEKIIRFLNTYNVPGSEELLNHFYHRQNQFSSIEKRLENERNEKIYVVLLSVLGKAKTIKDFKEIISKYTKIKNYKNVSSILLQCEASIQNIIEQEEYERKDKIYNEAIEYLKQSKDNAILQKAIDLLKTIRDFKEAEVLIAKAVSLIFDNNEEIRKSKIYDRGIIGLDSNDFNHLEVLLKELNTVDNYKDIINLKEQYNQKIDKLKETIYQQASIDIKNASITELEKAITTLNRIIDYKDSKKLIEIYNKKISSIKLEEEEKKKANLEEVYLSGLISDEEKITENLLKNKIKTLSGIENYKDSKKIIQSYKKYLNELVVERRKKQFKKYSLVFLKFYLPLLILIFIIFQVTTKTIIPTVNYNQGIKLFENGNYEEAIKRFNKTNKNDNIDKYIIAAESGLILESGDYLSAITMLESIGAEIDVDYDESTTQLLALSYSSYSPKENGYSFIKWDLDDYELKIKNDDIKANIYLKAIWKINDYSVKFNSNGGTSYSNIDFNIEDDDIILPTPNKTGHTFMGWYNNSNFTGSKITSINKGSYGNINLYAKWEVNKYDLILDFNDQKNESVVRQVLYGNSLGELPIPSREGYEFLGWYYQNNNLVKSSDKFLKEQSQTITAKWTKEYVITFKYNDNKTNDTFKEIIKGREYGVLPNPNRTGYRFLGWFDENNQIIKSNNKYNLEQSQTLFAKWEANSYIITFDYSDNVTNPYTRSIKYDDNYGELPNPSRTGYKFLGWYDSSNNKIISSDVYLILNNQTLSAKWEANSYIITFDYNDDTNNSTYKNVLFNDNYGELPTPNRQGYNFLGWHDSNNRIIRENDGFNIASNIILKAKWDLITYVIRLNIFENDFEYIYFDMHDDIIAIPNYERLGYRFLGWKDNKNEIIKYIDPLICEDVELIAEWELITYLVKFDTGYLDVPNPEDQIISYFDGIKYPLISHSNSSLKFLGWFDISESTKEPYDFTKEISSDLTLYAKWVGFNSLTLPFTINTFGQTFFHSLIYQTITVNVKRDFGIGYGIYISVYEADIGGPSHLIPIDTTKATFEFDVKPNKLYIIQTSFTGTSSNPYAFVKVEGNDSQIPQDGGKAKWVTDDYNIEYIFNDDDTSNLIKPIKYNDYLELIEPERDGYTFLGWYNYKNEKIENSIYKLNRSEVLTAFWEVNTYKVTFDYNDQLTPPFTKEIVFDEIYGDLPTPEKQGYEFLGWFNDSNIKINETTIVKKSSDHTLVANWQPQKMSLTLNYSDGITSNDIKTITYDETYDDLPNPNRTGYKLLGWYDGESKIENTTTVKKDFDYEIIAKWEPIQYILTMNYNNVATSNDKKTVTFDESYGSLPKPIKIGYTFIGWYIDEDLIEEDVIVKRDYDHEIIAKWEVIIYHASFVSNGGTSFDEIDFTIYSENIVFPIPEKEGYTFIGWYNNESLTGESFSELLPGTFEDIVLYADWEVNNYIITLNRNDGSGIIDEVSVIFDSEYNLPKISRNNYIFEGWFFEQNYDHELKNTDLVKIANNHHVYAMWIEGTDLFEFERKEDHYKIVFFDKTAKEAIIPNTYKGLPVSYFNASVFRDTMLEKIIIPNSILEIKAGSFKGSNYLTEMTLPFIGKSRDAYRNQLTRESVFGYIFGEHQKSKHSISSKENDFVNKILVETDEENVVWQWSRIVEMHPGYCNDVSSYYYIPRSLKVINITDANQIPFAAFNNIDFIEEINFNSEITKLESYALSNMSINNIILPDNIEKIGTHAFENSTIDNIELPINLTKILEYAFFKISIEMLTIPDSVTLIDDRAFESSNINHIELSEHSQLNNIGNYAFYKTQSIQSIFIPKNVIEIGEGAFALSNIETVVFDENSKLNNIGKLAFSQMLNLRSIIIPKSVTSIGEYAFSYSSALESIIFEEESSLKLIGKFAFNNNLALTNIQIPESVTTIGNSAFSGTSSLESISLPFVGNFKGSERVFGVIFGTTNYNGSYSANGYYLPNTLTEIIITNETKIGSSAFKGINKIESIIISEGLTSIGSEAFSGVSSLTSFIVPNSVTHIGMSAFSDMNALETITIPFVGDYFGYIFGQTGYVGRFIIPSSLKNVIITKAETIYNKAFNSATNITSISLPSSLTYVTSDAFEQATSLVSISVDEQNQYYSSEDGILFNKNKTEIIKYPSGKTNSLYVIPSSVTTIKAWSFYRTSFLEKVVIPSGVLNIEQYAFWFFSGSSFFLEVEEKPIGWHNNWNEDKDVYWLSEWYYNDFGEPTPL